MATRTEIERLAERVSEYLRGDLEGTSEESFDLMLRQLRRSDPDNPSLKMAESEEDDRPRDTRPHRYEIPNIPTIHSLSKVKLCGGDCCLHPKVKGTSVHAQYVNGKLECILTDGDGISGLDVTPDLRELVPFNLIDSSFTGVVSGDMAFPLEVSRKKFFGELKPERDVLSNISSGSVTEDELDGMEFIATNVRGVSKDSDIDNSQSVSNWLRVNGFILPETLVYDDWTDDGMVSVFEGYRDRGRYRAKGVSIVSKDYRKLDDGTFTPEIEKTFLFGDTAITRVIDIDWVPKTSGEIRPFAVVEPFTLWDREYDRVIVPDTSLMTECYLGAGSDIRVRFWGYYPSVLDVLSPGDPKYPDRCPSCGAETRWEGSKLTCPNPSCDNKVTDRLWKWVRTIAKVDGLRKPAIDSLFDMMGIETIDDLYDHLDDIEYGNLGCVGVKLQRYRDMARRLRRDVPADVFLTACSIPRAGASSVDKLGHHMDLLLYAPMNAETIEEIMSIKGVKSYIKAWVVDNLEDIRRWSNYPGRVVSLSEIEESASGTLDRPKVFAISGRLSKSRSEFIEEMAYLGYSPGFIGSASYLITDGVDASAMERAEDQGLMVMSEDEFREMVGA